jgi:leader peptidase (prepilin peptidase)/N-methyltransferase
LTREAGGRCAAKSPEDAAFIALLSGVRRWLRPRRTIAGRRLRWPVPATAVLSCFCAFVLANRIGVTPVCALLALAVVVLLALAIIDAISGLLPDVLTLPFLWLGLTLAWAGGSVTLHDAVAGAMVGYGFLYGLFYVFRVVRGREGMGHGDFKLVAAVGAWLGPLALAQALLVASVLAVLYAIGCARTAGLSSSYPFGPFVAAGAIVVLMGLPGLHLGL